MPQPPAFEDSSGNVWEDLRLPNHDELMEQANLVTQIDTIIRQRKLPHRTAARMLDLAPAELSRLFRADFHLYPVHRLRSFLTSLQTSRNQDAA